MKLASMDWRGFLEEVSLWGQLSIPARRTFLDGVRPGLGMEAPAENAAVAELREAGFLADYGNAGYLTVDPDLSGLHRLLKILERIAVFESAGFDILREYFTEHFTKQERAMLHESLAFHPDDFGRISALVASTEWLEDFLSRNRTRKTGAPVWNAARGILRFFMEQRDHVPLRDMEEYFPKLDRPSLASALKAGVQSAVFFLSLRKNDLEPLIGIWPSVARRLKKAGIALAPEAVAPEKSFCHPFLLEDMATLLLSANVEPIPVRRSDEKPFARFEEEASSSLLSLPSWMEEFTGATARIRVESALAALRAGGLLREEKDGDAIRYRPAEDAPAWALSGIAERRMRYLDRAASRRRGGKRQVNESPGFHAGRQARADRPAVLLSILLGAGASWADSAEELLQPLVQAFASAPRSSFLRFRDFSLYQAAMANPLISLREMGGGSFLRAAASPTPKDEFLEDLWQSFLHAFLSFGLMAMGGAEAGRSAGNQPCFMVNETGRWLLQLAEHPEPDGGGSGKADILIQPTFEVAFLSPSPAAEAEIGRFAERTGREVGALFRITKPSVQRAARSGLSAERVIGSLRTLSKNPVPQNVEHEIADWIRQSSV